MTTPNPIDDLLHAIETATMPGCTAYALDARLDATVPGWRFERRGAEAILAEYRNWFADPGHFETLRRIPFVGGEVVEYTLTWDEGGVTHAAHHVHVVELVGGRIVKDTVMCGGRWPASLVAQMQAATNG